MAALVVASYDSTKVFPQVDRALDDISAFVRYLIETSPRSASTCVVQSVFLHFTALGANTTDATVSETARRKRVMGASG